MKKLRKNHLPPNVQTHRSTCYQCFRPESLCICQYIKREQCHLDLTILRHPNERKKYYSTVNILKQAISNLSVQEGIYFEQSQIVINPDDQEYFLLYPSKNSQFIENLNLPKNAHIIVIDGTWREARKIQHVNPFLKTLPALSFNAAIKSQYKIRKQPKSEFLNTLESIQYLLMCDLKKKRELESYQSFKAHYQNLMNWMNLMVKKQLQFIPDGDKRL